MRSAKPRTRSRQRITLPPPEVLAVRPNVAMKMIGVGPSTFFKFVREREIETIKLGPNLTLVLVASLRTFLARHAGSAPSLEQPDTAVNDEDCRDILGEVRRWLEAAPLVLRRPDALSPDTAHP